MADKNITIKLAADINNLKAQIKEELKRRGGQGSL